ncbi:MAG TPA: 2-oxoacid:acceptor oxidoreductase subunit alpha [Candidatus Woesearchaeota archaeon]|nr:2-oxoacid:acceptor oxidoreductase subunit alpha [Candidatus Woesearchaeota archaeon]
MNTITIGGKAGDGIKAAGEITAKLLNSYGYHIFLLDDYPSLIKGGHNFQQITFDKSKLNSYYEQTDVLLALNEDALKKHKNKLKDKSLIIYDSNSLKEKIDGAVAVPAQDFVNEINGIPIMRNSVLLGALCFALSADIEILNELFIKEYGKKAEPNIKLALRGYEEAGKQCEPLINLTKQGGSRKLMSGNQAISLGAVKGGLEVYIAYPMTPASSILHYLAANRETFKVKTVQPENEIAAINMVIGSAFAGAKTMTGTSGGGFALMTEAVSLAGQSETPILIVNSQRPGPSTGVPTYTGQGDLNQALGAGHGEFPKLVLAPGTHEQAFYKTAEALNLAWKYQTPVILLSDKHLSESTVAVELDEKKIEPFNVRLSKGSKRYKLAENGISTIIIPGTPNSIVKGTSYEHDESGITTENPDEIVAMINKRTAKYKSIKNELETLETVKVYGEGANVIVTWGSTIGAVLEAVKTVKDVKVIQVLYMEPFPKKKLESELKKAKKTICIEANSTGQLADLVLAKTGIVLEKMLKYDGRQFEPLQLADALRGWLK